MSLRIINEKCDLRNIEDAIYKDCSLSAKERGLLSTIIRLEEYEDCSLRNLASKLSDCEEAISCCLKKLEKKGYIRWITTRGSRGQFETVMEIRSPEETSACKNINQTGITGPEIPTRKNRMGKICHKKQKYSTKNVSKYICKKELNNNINN